MSDTVIIVDTNDKILGEMEKMEAHRHAHLHRAVSVFIFNSKGQLLLQKRSSHKYHSSGLWSNTVCTHPCPDERNEDAAIRRLKEEMGIAHTKLTKLFDFIYKEKLDNGLTEYEYDHVFTGISDIIPNPLPTEASDYKYVDPETLLGHIRSNPDEYTVWLRKIIDRVLTDARNIDLIKQ